MRHNEEESSWLDDAFDEKKAAAEREQMSNASVKVAGCGCIVVVCAFAVLMLVTIVCAVGLLA